MVIYNQTDIMSSLRLEQHGQGKIGNVVTLEIYNLRTFSNLSGTIRIVNNLGIFTPKYDKTFTVSAIPGSGAKYGGIMVCGQTIELQATIRMHQTMDYMERLHIWTGPTKTSRGLFILPNGERENYV